MPPFRLLIPLLGLALVSAMPAAPTRERDSFDERLDKAVRSDDAKESSKQLESLIDEARVQNRPDRVLRASVPHLQLKVESGDFRRVRQELRDYMSSAIQLGQAEEEFALDETYAAYWLAQGNPVAAAEWLERAWRLALAMTPQRRDLARHSLARLAELHESIGQEHLADQAAAWVALIDGDQAAPLASIQLQPLASSTRIPNGEIGRTRLFLANTTLAQVTGTLLIEGGDLLVKEWRTRGDGEVITLQFPSAAAAVPQSPAQGRRLTLQPGETRTVMLEVEPGVPPRVADRTVAVSWQSGASTSTSVAEFHFRRPREFPATSAANACHVRLSPLVSVPVSMEVSHRGVRQRHLQDLCPITSAPCRVELYEVLTAGATSRHLLAVDANGDGEFDAAGDAVVTDRDGTGFPEVAFAPEKPVAALEVRLYPLPSQDGSVPEDLDLTVSLRDGLSWRVPPDVDHRVKTR